MKRFVFHLDSVLRMRAREEAAAREILEHALAVQRRAKSDLDEALVELERCEEALGSQRGRQSSVNDHLILLNAASVQRDYRDRLATRLAEATQKTETLRKLHETAGRKHQAILRLQERHRRVHAAREQRHEENQVSDLILSRHPTADRPATV